jgi:hypothetical protein
MPYNDQRVADSVGSVSSYLGFGEDDDVEVTTQVMKPSGMAKEQEEQRQDPRAEEKERRQKRNNEVTDEPLLDSSRDDSLSDQLAAAFSKKKDSAPEHLPAPPGLAEQGKLELAPPPGRSGAGQSVEIMPDQDAFVRFQAERRRSEGLTYQAARGYWANTYVPGDPAFLRLFDQVSSAGDSQLRAFLSHPPQLWQFAERAPQPFDVPADAAMNLFLNSDVSAIEGPTRMLIQIGLQGTTRQSGSRSGMHVAIVADLESLSSETERQLFVELLRNFDRQKQPGDRFSLYVSGVNGGLVIPESEFRRGSIEVATREHFGSAAPASGNSISITKVLNLATNELAAKMSDDAQVGSSLLIFATDGNYPQAATREALSSIAQKSGLSGVPLSVMSIGDEGDIAFVSDLAATGQGRRRYVREMEDCESAAKGEIVSAANVVGRALRLRIRLAPGVHLVDIPGSHSLDVSAATAAKEIESRIDARVARSLGIEADRGDDEDGIQILIPAFQAGDSHVILLDVVSDRPGPLVDVSLRYKDLVGLRNGVTRANLSIAAGQNAPGARELNVTRSYLAFQFSKALEEAARAVSARQVRSAIRSLDDYRKIARGLQQKIQALAGDSALLRDLAVADDFLALLENGAGLGAENRQLVNALDLSARLKILPKPANHEL